MSNTELPSTDSATTNSGIGNVNIPNPHPDQALIAQLQPGDIIFYKPAPNQGWKNFPTVADFVQSFPYVGRRPWFHVAICIGPEVPVEEPPIQVGEGPLPRMEVIGFETNATADAEPTFEGQIALQYLNDLPANVRLDVLRPGPAFRSVIVHEAKKTQGRAYSINGLVAFAMAMQARMMPASQDRDDLYNAALGLASRAGQTDEETCVTAVIEVLEAAGLKLIYPEPQKPLWLPFILDHELRGYLSSLAYLIGRLAEDDADTGSDELVDEQELDELLRRMNGPWTEIQSSPLELDQPIPDFGDVWYPGGAGPTIVNPHTEGVLRTHRYRETFKRAVEQLDPDWDELIALGKSLEMPETHVNQNSAVISPAMLFHALFSAGFTPVGSLDLPSGPPGGGAHTINLQIPDPTGSIDFADD